MKRHLSNWPGVGRLRRLYMRLREPRVVTAIHGGVYAVLAVAGVLTLFWFPMQTEYSGGGYVLAALIAVFFIVGGAGGVITILRGDQWAERFAIWVVMVGVFAYTVTVGVTAAVTPGAQFMGVVGWGVLIPFLVTRLIWVLERPYRPGSIGDKQRKRRQRRRAKTSHHTDQ